MADLPREITSHYDAFAEESRLAMGPSQLEFERTKEILLRVLPSPPARIVDVGGAAGAYSFWLAGRGYEVHLVDASARLVAEATRRNGTAPARLASAAVGDARALPQEAGFASVVLLMGPLYHLVDAGDRALALREAFRVLSPGGVVAAAAISRYASALDGLARSLTLDPRFVEIRNRDLDDGQHRNTTGRIDYFTTAYFHRPDDLQSEIETAGFGSVSVLGVEGPCWLVGDFDERWADPIRRADLLDTAQRLERAPSLLGVSAHLLGTGRK